MASRRSRLKAVTNLPIRRKPVSVQEESEISKADDCKTTDPAPEEKEQDIKGCEDSNSSEKPQCNEIGKVSFTEKVEIEPEKHDKTEVPPADVPIPKPSNDIKSLPAPASRFGRRIKPSVSSVVLKDKTPREAHVEGHAQSNEKPVIEEIQLIVRESECPGSNENESSKNFTELEATSKDITLLTVPDTVETETVEPINLPTENVIEVIEIKEGQNINENQQLLNTWNEVNLRTAKELVQSNVKVPVNKVQQNASVHVLGPVDKIASDGNTKQGNEVLPNHSNILNYFSNQLTPPSNSHLQNSSTGVKKTLTSFKQKKPKFNDFARKVADARREFQRKYEKIPPDRSSLRMIDLIFYNPSTNPMESKSKCERRDSHSIDEELLDEKVDDPESLDKSSEINDDDDMRNDDFGKMPVPQVKIGLNGEIILDEKSLVIETTEAKKGREDLQNSALIFEDRGSKTCYYKRKTHKSRDWSDLETKRFYKALNTIGTDFSLMQKYFPVRTRLELKNKFKREEKLNRNLVDKALNNPSEFDITQFEKYLAMEKQVEEEESDRRLQRKIKLKKSENRVRTKSSLMAREITEPDENVAEFQSSSNPDSPRIMLSEKSKESDEITLLDEKYTLQTPEEVIGGCVQQPSPAIIFDGSNQGSGFSSSSRVFTSLNELSNANKIRDAFDEIQNIGHGESNVLRAELPDNVDECGELKNNAPGNVGDVVDEFYQAVVSLSASLKSDECKNRLGKRVRSKNEKKKIVPYEKKNRKNPKDYAFMSTLDIETYECDYDNYSSSNESNDNSIISTKTISDQDFIKLLAANAKNMKESKIQFQITEGCSFEKNVEIILDNVPSIALSEI